MSDILLQIVDARNPLFFRSPDLESYVREVGEGKRFIIILNKADLVNEANREEWVRWLR